MIEAASPKENSVASSPFSSPNIGALLKIKILSWSRETGLPVSVRVRVGDRIFSLHKRVCMEPYIVIELIHSHKHTRSSSFKNNRLFTTSGNCHPFELMMLAEPHIFKSGYFKKRLIDVTELELPPDFPGGPETFEMIALLAYGSSTLIDPFNVATLRCAAEFLEMTEEYCSGNLCERFDLYLNQVVLQSWDDTLIVLQRCQTLLPWAEELLIVSRCIESLAFMACMEILDPERRRDKPVVTLEVLAGQPWSCETVKDIASQDLWIKDLIALPFRFFKRIVGSLRRQGMKEKFVIPIIIFYANKWVLSKKTKQFWENSAERIGDSEANNKVSTLLQGILELLPLREKASRAVPVGFYLALLSRSLEVGLQNESKIKLQEHISTLLHFAQVEDFLIPSSNLEPAASSLELATMESIFSKYVSFNADPINTLSTRNSVVAELWDAYLSHLAYDPTMGPKRFMELIEIVPITCRQCQDQLYRAVNNFLQAHMDLSQEEKSAICKYLNCQKLSQQACIEAVQNELMPLRLIVQALFVQQLNTHRAFKECSDSFRYAHGGEFSGSLLTSRCPNSRNLAESPSTEGVDPSRTLSFLLQKDQVMQTCEISRNEYESTSFRIQSLEQELMSLKKSLKLQNNSKKTEAVLINTPKPFGMESRSFSKRRNPLGQITGCIGSVNFSSQRRYVNRLLKVLRQITLFSSRKSKRNPSVPGNWTKPM